MHRFFVEAEGSPGSVIGFPAGAARQMARVLRLGPGARVVAVDPAGRQWLVRLTAVEPRAAGGVVEEELREDAEPPVRLVLAQGLPKGDKLELVIRKGTELGVARFLPTVCRRSVPRPAEAREARLARWRRVAREAAEQAGRRRVPAVDGPVSFGEAVGELARCDLFLLPWEEERSASLRSVLRRFAARGGGAGAAAGGRLGEAAAPGEGGSPAGGLPSVGVLVGPEGGLAPEEVAAAVAAGARVVTLGPRLLRTETAGLVVAAAVLYELGGLERT